MYSKGSFKYPKKDDDILWNSMPEGIDILVTHCPPLGILDKTNSNQLAGSSALKKWVFKHKPKVHIFGHIHESCGKMELEGITFLNVAKEAQGFLFECK
jgi:Icc-related predicted phosphoesterase